MIRLQTWFADGYGLRALAEINQQHFPDAEEDIQKRWQSPRKGPWVTSTSANCAWPNTNSLKPKKHFRPRSIAIPIWPTDCAD